MLKYVSKFVLEVMPSVVATVIGAYIVSHYVNPKSAEPPSTVAAAQDPAVEAKDITASTGSSDTVSAVDIKAKAADAKPVETTPIKDKPQDAKAGTAEAASPQSVAKPAPQEKKDANALAREAIDRLRGSAVDPDPAPVVRSPVEVVRTTPPARAVVQPAVSLSVNPPLAPPPRGQLSTANASPPPLPPPVIVAAPNRRYLGTDPAAANGPDSSLVPADQPVVAASGERPIPPAEIPPPPLPAVPVVITAGPNPPQNFSIAEHVLSTTRTFFRALTPRSTE